MKKYSFLIAVVLSVFADSTAQTQKPITELKWNLNEDGSRFFKFTTYAQIWMRYTQMNPGSKVNGYPVGNFYDIGIRRLRMQAYGQLTDKVFIYTQFGQNNYTFNSPRYIGAFFHDALAEYKLHKDQVHIGAGLTGWSGLSRYASPAIASILSVDAPLYQQATNGTTDQFLRKLSVYAKGKISRLDYRIALTNPLNAVNGIPNTTKPDTTMATFSPLHPHMQTQAYLKWEFWDKESNLVPYLPGCYLGSRKVLNLGAGFIYQPGAMRQMGVNAADTNQFVPMKLWNIDVYLDMPLSEAKENAATFYGAFSGFDFGKNYLRMIGVMNPTTTASAGNAFAMVGTGNTIYVQAGYLFGKKLLSSDARIQIFGATQYSEYQAKKDPMLMTEAGFNYFISGTHNNKISFVYQNRTVYDGLSKSDNKGMFVVQFQAGI